MNFLKKNISYLFFSNNNTVKDIPPRIVIELTNRCNLNCPYCLVGQQNNQGSVDHNSLNRPMGKMDINLGEKIIKEAKDFGIKEVMLTFQGEPLVHNHFVDFIKLTKKYNLRAVVFTNGLLLNKDLTRNIICSGLDSIRFSVDGATETTYQANRVGGTFEKVYQNSAVLFLWKVELDDKWATKIYHRVSTF